MSVLEKFIMFSVKLNNWVFNALVLTLLIAMLVVAQTYQTTSNIPWWIGVGGFIALCLMVCMGFIRLVSDFFRHVDSNSIGK